MSQTIIALADLIENVKLGGGSVITSITEQEPAAGPHASVAPPKFVDGKGSDSKSVFAFETRYIVEKPEDQDEPEKEEESKTAEKVVKGKPQRSSSSTASSPNSTAQKPPSNRAASTATKQSSRFLTPSSPTRPKTAP